MATPCKLTFFHTTTNSHKERIQVGDPILIPFVYRTEEEIRNISDHDVPVLTENMDLHIRFEGDPGARFYMDGLDMLPESMVKEDEKGDVYLSPSMRDQVLYYGFTSHDQSSYYPLIPGYYRIKVFVQGDVFHSIVRVKPKQVTEEQWEWMRNDIEETLHGLAQDLLRKNSHVSLDEQSPIPLTYLRQWLLLREKKAQLLLVAEELVGNPRVTIQKEHKLVPNTLAKRLDEKGIRFRLQHPEKRDVIKDAVPTLGFDLPENRWLVHILRTLYQTLQNLHEFLVSLERSTQLEMEDLLRWGKRSEDRVRLKRKVLTQIEEMLKDAKLFRSSWMQVLQAPWVQELTPGLPQEIPISLSSDYRYRLYYTLYRALREQDVSVALDPIYTYHWKRTDLLYEIWGFIQVVRLLGSEEMGFIPVKGWLYEEPTNARQVVVPELRSGASIEFMRDGLRVVVRYEEELPVTARETSLEQPLYTSSTHLHPDCRIDVYDKEGHIGSLLLDFKYRPLRSIWDRNLIKTQRQTKTMRQLDAYSSSCRSPWYLKGRVSEVALRRLRPVTEVWPVHPNMHGTTHSREIDDYHIRPMDLTPGSDQAHFRKQLEDCLEEMKGVAGIFTGSSITSS
ncbi:DUF2357 domain-containing protein [Sutcliffiella rhizosphaerae]|uniref:DUF2357 domain-containing protein n=1 Tax=Sutcliffiella rhizosphaerae TaxID=2880967 RepID=A0ABM8YTD9_9BACI|nr:DUF2357 domain-containing protein [Sutcliffiella rhizosphaerae]CAG9623293.1 hypothetical protein BACCIP111883_04094 [Sutcliffiella rhizosphaerae]